MARSPPRARALKGGRPPSNPLGGRAEWWNEDSRRLLERARARVQARVLRVAPRRLKLLGPREEGARACEEEVGEGAGGRVDAC